MKLIIKTKTPGKKTFEKHYLVRLPNYFNIDQVQELLQTVQQGQLLNEVIIEHTIYGDNALSLDERKQMDTEGKVIRPPIELTVEI